MVLPAEYTVEVPVSIGVAQVEQLRQNHQLRARCKVLYRRRRKPLLKWYTVIIFNTAKGKTMNPQTALITGASSGIGLELATLFAKRNNLSVARTKSDWRPLRNLHASQQGDRLAYDLAQPSAPEAIVQELQTRGLTIDYLVNNAGTQVYGPIQDTDVTRQLQLIQVNLVALTHLTMLLLPDMVKRGAGRILNLSSIGGFAPAPLNAIYCASKAYILASPRALPGFGTHRASP